MAEVQFPAEQRVVLRNVRWKTYECLLKDHEDSSAPRFTYDRGILEIMSPLPEHEASNRTLASLVEIVCEERETKFRNLGSTTIRREDLERGFEPDSCFYIQNEGRIRGRRTIDLRTEPPPDLVIEIDITHSTLYKLSIYAQFGVPEVWRWDGRRLEIRLLEGDRYADASQSRALPGVTAHALGDLVGQSAELGRIEWLRRARSWARGLRR